MNSHCSIANNCTEMVLIYMSAISVDYIAFPQLGICPVYALNTG